MNETIRQIFFVTGIAAIMTWAILVALAVTIYKGESPLSKLIGIVVAAFLVGSGFRALIIDPRFAISVNNACGVAAAAGVIALYLMHLMTSHHRRRANKE